MRKKAFRFCAGIVGILLIASVLAYGLYTHRPQPPNIRQKIFRGVTYERVSFRNPRPMVVHIITVDLKASQAKFFTTPPVSGLKYPYRAQPVSDFLQKNKLQLAINADFFKPSWSHGPWDYYPHRGDPVYARSLSMHQGKVITPATRHQPSLYFSKDGVPSFEPGPHPYDAISGESIFLRGGRWTLRDPDKDGWRTSIQPRNCIGLSADGSRLLILVVDGRQPGYSEGATLKELAKIALDYGADTMLDLDGGGSETLVWRISLASQPSLTAPSTPGFLTVNGPSAINWACTFNACPRTVVNGQFLIQAFAYTNSRKSTSTANTQHQIPNTHHLLCSKFPSTA